MAYTNFYIQSGGANANSGTSLTNTIIWSNTSAVVYTSAGASSTITMTDSSASAIAVNDYINIGGTFVVQVTAVSNVGSAYTITFNATAGTFWGANPGTTTYNTNGQVVDGGAWGNYAQGILTGGATIPSSTIVNSNLSYTLVGTLTWTLNGTASKSLWYRLYNTTPGDLDNGSTSLAYPAFAVGNNQFQDQGAYTKHSGFAFTSSTRTTYLYAANGLGQRYAHCRFTNTNSNSGAYAFLNNSAASCVSCYFSAPATASQIVGVSGTTGSSDFLGCYFTGNAGTVTVGLSISTNVNGAIVLSKCTFNNCGLYGIQFNTGNTNYAINVDNCTFNNCGVSGGGDAIRFTTLPSNITASRISNCIFANSGAYNINNPTGTVGAIYLVNNDNYNAASGHSNGFGDFWEIGASAAGVAAITELSSPFVSSTDLHLTNTALGAGAGLPGQWENV